MRQEPRLDGLMDKNSNDGRDTATSSHLDSTMHGWRWEAYLERFDAMQVGIEFTLHRVGHVRQ